MRTIRRILTVLSVVSLLMAPCLALAAFDSGSTGEDGALEVTENTTLQLPPDGVFNFTTVHVASGATLRFKKNEKNTPVTILASGDVLIEGAVNVNGHSGNYIIPGEGGPGGFDGGVGASAKQNGRRGEGPGGGYGGKGRSDYDRYVGGGGGGGFAGRGGRGNSEYSSWPGGNGGDPYGNERIIPLIGGSGGGGGGGTSKYVGGSGGGGGGAIVIASSGGITIKGGIYANGGRGAKGGKQIHSSWAGYLGSYGGAGGGGAGGSIRLIANAITGDGSLTAVGGQGEKTYLREKAGNGSSGRIRFEASSVNRTTGTNPPMSMSYPYAVTPPNMPSLKIASIAGEAVPEVPRGDFGAPDITLPYNARNPLSILVQGANIPVGSTVTLRSNPAIGSTTSGSGTLEGTLEASAASVNLNISTAYPSVITAFVTYELTALNLDSFYINGEKVEKIRVASTMGEDSTITYITESGKEIPARI